MRKLLRIFIVAAAFFISAVLYSCGSNQDIVLPLNVGAQGGISPDAGTEEPVTEPGGNAGAGEGTGAQDPAGSSRESGGRAAAASDGGDEDEGSQKAADRAAGDAGGSGQPDAAGTQGVYVYICGAVKYPDVYELMPDARVVDAVKRAGGFTDEADRDYLNLAGGIRDGQKIYVPTRQEVSEGSVPAPQYNTADDTGEAACAAGVAGPAVSEQEQRPDNNAGKVNINSATAEELTTLKGIGDKRAKDIIDYRNSNGGFKSIEDIKKVNGIKDGIYAGIRDDITV